MANLSARKRRLIVLLSVLLVGGYLLTSLIGYTVSVSSVRTQIRANELPLTSDNIYSEIQRDLLTPIFIASVMASDTFVRDWLLAGEQDEGRIRKYLNEIKQDYDAFTSFLVSDVTRTYYHADGILKRVDPEEPRDEWYFRVRDMEAPYEINVDPDMANADTMTIFINHRVFDYEGRYIGATGVGLSTDNVKNLIKVYQQKYNRQILFVDQDGNVVMHGGSLTGDGSNIRDMEGLSGLADQILNAEPVVTQYESEAGLVHLNSRYIPELEWHLIVRQTEEAALEAINSTLFVNLSISGVIALVAVLITMFTVNAYERTGLAQEEQILSQHRDLRAKNEKLEEALATVRTLGGLIPICASCKKIRDDSGYWRQIEVYLREHSEAEFSHGICPDCARRLYPDMDKPPSAEDSHLDDDGGGPRSD